MNETTYRTVMECIDLIFDCAEEPYITILTKLVDLAVEYENEHYYNFDEV